VFRILTVLSAALIVLFWPALGFADTDYGAQHERLQTELQRHRVMADAGGWPIVSDGPTIRPGSEDSRLGALARRLAISGDLLENEISASMPDYNESLQSAVRRFQVRHGLAADALVGRATLRALNVSIEQRIDQIRVNLARARELFESPSDDLVLVNVAAFKVYVIRDGKTVWETRVIVGDKRDKTPVFGSVLKSVVFNPTWTVPYRIASEELLPKIKEDPGFFDKGKYQLFDRAGNRVDPAGIDWPAVGTGNFPFTLVQQPGPANQLGQIKFMFPNEYSVCMHDTPGKSLFAEAARAFSHGCIRVDEPLGLAEVLLADEGWTREQIDTQIESEETRTVVLSEPLPIRLIYRTAEVDDLGRIYFYNDVYERDAALIEALDIS
jgi:murein L,D-transpeptidase YcbB/YkuD